MKTTGRAKLTIEGLEIPDNMNNTKLFFDRVLCWPGNDELPNAAKTLHVEVPSGDLYMKVEQTSTVTVDGREETTIWGDAVWEGSGGGILGGRCAIGSFEFEEGAIVVETSAHPTPMSLWTYSRVKTLCNEGFRGHPEENRAAMRAIFAVLHPPAVEMAQAAGQPILEQISQVQSALARSREYANHTREGVVGVLGTAYGLHAVGRITATEAIAFVIAARAILRNAPMGVEDM